MTMYTNTKDTSKSPNPSSHLLIGWRHDNVHLTTFASLTCSPPLRTLIDSALCQNQS